MTVANIATMTPARLLAAIVYPFTATAVLIPLVVYWLLIAFALWGGVLGLFLLFLVVPAVFRSQMILLEARARGAEPATPDVEFFSWFGSAWTLFPAPVIVALVWSARLIAERFGIGVAEVFVSVCVVLLPSFVAVLAITRSPLQSLNPIAHARFFRRCGATIWIASIYLLLAGLAASFLGALPTVLAIPVLLALSYGFFSLVGSLIEPYRIVDDVDIPEPREATAAERAADLVRQRTATLNHAYGFVSRGNREGGFRHIIEHIGRETDPIGAWAWFIDGMLRWEDRDPALHLAQRFVHELLAAGEAVRAVKLILRCRLVDERFKPFTEDRDAAVAAAEATGNAELAAVLKRG